MHAAQGTLLGPFRRLSLVLILARLEPVNCQTLHGWQRSFALHRVHIDSSHSTDPHPIEVRRRAAVAAPGLTHIQTPTAFPEHIDDASIWDVLSKPHVEETALFFG